MLHLPSDTLPERVGPSWSDLPSTIPGLLSRAALRWPDAIALNLFERGDRLTYAQLRDAVLRFAHGLHLMGVRHGDHVAVMLPNRVEFPIAWLALAEIGAVMVPMVLASTSREIEFFLSDSAAQYLVVEQGLLAARGLTPGQGSVPPAARIVTVGADGPDGYAALVAGGNPSFVPSRAPSAGDLVNIQYTSGTTGLPKGTMLTHRYWVICGVVPQVFFGMTFDSILATAPFFYMDSQWMLCATISCGGRLDMAERPSITKFVDQVNGQQSRVAWLFEQVLKSAPRPEEQAAGMTMLLGYHQSPAVIAEAEARFRAPVREVYGSTEVGFAIAVPHAIDDPAIIGTCGVAVPFRRLRVVRPDGTDADAGEAGELWVAGDGILLGYWNRPEANAELMVDGWFRTGDLFVRDANGFYSIVGRLKDMVRRSGENIAAIEVEQVLIDMPEIANAAVVPVPDADREEEVKAYVELAAGVTTLAPEAIIAHCRARLAPFKVPRYLTFVDDFPYTPSEKISKRTLIDGVADLRTGAWDAQDGVQR